jgi:glucose-6-phosphate 1-epimerase
MRDGSSWGAMGSEAATSVDTSGPLPIVRLSGGKDEAIVNLFGGCVTSYKTSGTEWIAVRPDAKLDGSKPISGGLPHCFPQFGPGAIQQHGFARNFMWRLLEEPSENGVCVLELSDSEETRKIWPFAFRAEYRVELLEGRLKTSLKISNSSKKQDAKEFFFTTALHSYFAVDKIGACEIRGSFKGAEKIDKTEDPAKVTEGTEDTIKISKFTEEIYKDVLPGSVVLQDPSKGELEIISGEGWKDVVVWNPFGDEAMGADNFVCVESAALEPVTLAPGGVWDATLELVPKPKS